MSCISFVRYAVLINHLPTPFFEAARGLRHGFALSPLIFILIMDGFSKVMHRAVLNGYIEGFSFSESVSSSQFVDDMLLFGSFKRNHWFYIHYILIRFGNATGLHMNSDKSFLIYEYGDMDEITFIASFLRVSVKRAFDGFKYLGFYIKPYGYRIKDWIWLVDRIRSKINKWTHRWLSMGGRLIMIQAVLSQLFVFWCHQYYFTESIISSINKIMAQFLWGGSNLTKKFHLVRLEVLC